MRSRERVLRLPGELQVVALAGRNADLLKRLQVLAKQHPGKLFPLGFTTTVERVMTAADLVVTKPGGLSVSECLAKERPMLLVSPIPGQEERNADYLLECGAAIKAVDAATLEFKLARLLADRPRLAAMSAAAKRVARPRAAADVVALISAFHMKRTPAPGLVCRSHGADRGAGRRRPAPPPRDAPCALGRAHRARGRAQPASHLAHALSQRAADRARHEKSREAGHPHRHQSALFQRRRG